MLRVSALILCLSAVSGIPFLCRKSGITPPVSETCGLERTAIHQGSCLCCYNNTADIPTIGIGFTLLRADAQQKLEPYGLKLEDVLGDCRDATTRSCLTNDEAIDLYNTVTYPQLEFYAEDYVAKMPPLAKAAVADIAISGYEKLKVEKNFPGFRDALRLRNFKDAATALLKTRWCRSVPKQRCESNAKCIASLCSPSGSCNRYDHQCSTTSHCICYETPGGFNVCGPTFGCDEYPSCAKCPEKTSVCVVRSCCRDSCIPLSVLDKCPPANMTGGWMSDLGDFRKTACLRDSDCFFGRTCKFHSNGKFCS